MNLPQPVSKTLPDLPDPLLVLHPPADTGSVWRIHPGDVLDPLLFVHPPVNTGSVQRLADLPEPLLVLHPPADTGSVRRLQLEEILVLSPPQVRRKDRGEGVINHDP